MVFGTAIAVAIINLTHRAVDAKTLYGFYVPRFAYPQIGLSPFLNANNLAGYLNLGAFCGVALLLARRHAGPVWLLLSATALLFGVSMLATSQGGVLALGIGILLFCLLQLALSKRFSRNDRYKLRWTLGFPILALLAGAALFFHGASANTWANLQHALGKKIALVEWSGPMIKSYALTGAGRGAFETAFPAFRQDRGLHIYTHAENFVAQWCAEWGIIVAPVALIALTLVLFRKGFGILGTRSSVAIFCGVVSLLVHNLVDLALELASVGIALSALLATLYAGARRSRSREKIRSQTASLTFGAVCILLLGAVGFFSIETAQRDRDNAGSWLKRADTTNAAQALEAVKAAVRRHPSDPFLVYVGASINFKMGNNPLPWVARAIERDPMEGRPYLLLAYVLASMQAKDQALAALRRAAARDHRWGIAGAKLALSLSTEPSELKQAVPSGAIGAMTWLAFARLAETPSLREQLVDRAIAQDPTHAPALKRKIKSLLAALENKEARCAAERRKLCTSRARQILQLLAKLPQERDEAIVLKARMLIAVDQLEAAEALLRRDCAKDNPQCLKWRLIAAKKQGRSEEVTRLSKQYLDTACRSRKDCVRAARWLGDQAQRQENWELAARMYERAALESSDKALWDRTAKMALRAGLDALARRALQQAAGAQR